jgi:sporulation protein YlmC with PRC-barrel domain
MSVVEARTLHDRAVIQADSAERVGTVEDVVLDPGARMVDGLLVSRGHSLFGGKRTFVPASQVRAVGPDAILVLVRASDDDAPAPTLPNNARLSELVGRKVVSDGGEVIGAVRDVLIDDAGLQLEGYTLEDTSTSGSIRKLLFGHAGRSHEYIPAAADLRIGPDVNVVPDDALLPVDGLHTSG